MVKAVDDLLGDAPRVEGAHLGLQVLLGVGETILVRKVHGNAQSPPVRDDGDLVDRIVIGDKLADDGMP